MISIIVYGRNDSRGYGMEKRVALSLNAMAHVLTAPTSEIIFVDYNTPDHLPTLPELLRDTLTEAAQRRVRVLRARPSLHARFADLTLLPVLEPIARNIALRRTCPRNRWILSTNTDSIIALKTHVCLEELVGDLDKGLYGAPRFELPERAWEMLDRRAPDDAIARAGMWGRAMRLDETVFGEGAALFDGPGDFQLAPRSALFAIDGFDEAMLQGWHVDHNIAVRLEMLLGKTRSLHDHLNLYHCGHHRQATQTHAPERLQNDVGRFVNRVSEAHCPGQRDAWGCPDDAIEEIDLRQPSAEFLVNVLARSMSPLDEAGITSHFNHGSYDNFWYDAGHVTSHLLDLTSTFSLCSCFAYAGVRADLFNMICKGLQACGFSGPMLVPDACAARLDASDCAFVNVVDAATFAGKADVLVFEFGLVRDEGGKRRATNSGVEPTDVERAALDTVRERFDDALADEALRLATGAPPRLLVSVNAVHNRFESGVASRIAAVPAPFSTRLRYGNVLHPPAASGGALAQQLAAQAPGGDKPDESAIRGARALIRDIVRGDADLGELNCEIAASAALIRAIISMPAGRLPAEPEARVMARVADAERPQIEPPFAGQEFDGPPGFASLSTWRDPAWRHALGRLDAGRNNARRNGWVWERGQILWALSQRAFTPDCRALVVCEHPEVLLEALADTFGAVDVMDARVMDEQQCPRMSRPGDFGIYSHVAGGAFQVITQLDDATGPYDAIILPHASGFRHGMVGFAFVIGRLRPLLVTGGLLVVAGEAGLNGRSSAMRPGRQNVREKGLPALLCAHAAVELLAPTPDLILETDAPFVGSASDRDAGRPILGVDREGEIYWPFVWLFKASNARQLLEALPEATRSLLLGEQLHSMQLGAAARHENGAIVKEPGGEGHAVYGPFLPVGRGGHQAVLEVRGVAAHDNPRLVAEVSLDGHITVQLDMPPLCTGAFAHTFTLPFVCDPEGRGVQQAICEVRLWTDGACELEIRSVTINRVELTAGSRATRHA